MIPPKLKPLHSDQSLISLKLRAFGKLLTEVLIDLGVPSSRKETVAMLSKIEKLLLAGRNVGVHCRQSVGRSGMIAASLLVLSGSDPRKAFESVSKDRGLPVPETNEQPDWVIDLARELEPAVTPG